MPRSRILIVDDEESVRDILTQLLSIEYDCVSAGDAKTALEICKDKEFDLLIADINLGGMSGIELIGALSEFAPLTPAMVISGAQTVENAIEAMRKGAFDFVRKPFDLDHVTVAVERALTHRDLLVSKQRHENQLEDLVRERTAQLHHLAFHDPLTDLPNEVLFEDRLGQAIVGENARDRTAVMLLSIDNLNGFRDTLGNPAVNKVVVQAVERLRSQLAAETTISRFDGDVFAILLAGVGTDDAVDMAGAVLQALAAPFTVDPHELFLSVSIGISLFPKDGSTARELIRNAGAALSNARLDPVNSYSFFSTELNLAAAKRLAMENDLRRAAEQGQLVLFYQPKIETETERIVGAEALVRWNHPSHGMLHPGEFIPVAEANGSIDEIGRWVIRTACQQGRIWQDRGLDIEIAINLSRVQLRDPRLVDGVREVIADTKCDARYMEFEVTESTIMHDIAGSQALLRGIRELGVRIGIDDFGTGHSSLAALRYLPLDTLKIDRSFITDLNLANNDVALIRTIVVLAHNLGLKVVAEGVETGEQLQMLKQLNCDQCQGYLFGEPMTAEQFESLIH